MHTILKIWLAGKVAADGVALFLPGILLSSFKQAQYDVSKSLILMCLVLDGHTMFIHALNTVRSSSVGLNFMYVCYCIFRESYVMLG